MNYTLHQLHIFKIVAQKKSITKASEALFMTQPAVSIQLKQLQEQLGLSLFEFIGKQMHLTDAGKKLLECHKDLTDSLDRIETEMDSFKGMKTGKLTVSVVSSAKYFMPYILGQFRLKYPQVKIKLEVSDRLMVKNHLSENLTDFGVYSILDESIKSESFDFLHNPLVFITKPDSPYTKVKKFKDLENAPFIFREHGSGTRIKLERALKDNNIKPDIIMELGTTEAVKQAVMAGFGVSLVSKYAIRQELQTGAVAVIELDNLKLETSWKLMWLTGKQLSPAARAFHEFIEQKQFELSEFTI